jgi:hypothetical protein
MKKLLILNALFAAAVLAVPCFAGTIDLPKTGQTTSYASRDDGDLQAGVAWPEPRFTNDNGSTPITGDVVVDQLTGLMWTRDGNLPGDIKTWQQALDYVAAMNSGSGTYGYTDWRLPNFNELESLTHAGSNSATWLNSQGFTNVQQSYAYWSSTTYAYNTDYAWIVSMLSGYVGGVYKFKYDYVWPVRAGQCGPLANSVICLPKTGQTTCYDSSGDQISCAFTGQDGETQSGVTWPVPRFVDNTDGTVVDKLTGIMWTKHGNLPGGQKTWQPALDYVAGMNSGSGTYGYTDWRLPNRKELRSLIDYSTFKPALPQGHPFTNVQSYYYWSSTTDAYMTDLASIVSMDSGLVNAIYKSNYYLYVWPVRAGQCGSLDDWDNDTVCNDVDNCPDVYNPRQEDCDGDGTGDACDPDIIDPDGDGIDQACDICWTISNTTQQDTNSNCPAPPYTSDPKCGDACNVCMADYDNNGKTNLTDLGILKSEFGRTNCRTVPPACRADTNADDKVNLTDLGKLKGEFGKTNCFQ